MEVLFTLEAVLHLIAVGPAAYICEALQNGWERGTDSSLHFLRSALRRFLKLIETCRGHMIEVRMLSYSSGQ